MTVLPQRMRGLPLLLAMVLLWEVLPRLHILDPLLIPPFDQVVSRAWELLLRGHLFLHAAISLARVLGGFGLASLVSLPLGIALGLRPSWRAWFDPFLAILRPISPPAWIPLAILWFGIGDRPALFIIFVGTVSAMLVGIVAAAQDVDKQMVKAGMTLGATTSQVTWLIVLPSLQPGILAQLRIGLGLAWMCVIAAEMVAVRQGLGYMMIQARNLFQTDVVLVGMTTVGLIGWSLDLGLRAVGNRLLRWRRGAEAHELLDRGQGLQGV